MRYQAALLAEYFFIATTFLFLRKPEGFKQKNPQQQIF
ncbi:hypothetical protein EPYR_00206 [Erwinia pyrifoliae DSM 12163]|nr:hypothetical protein EPYR_00206 [Erwinia pyrifoliae DSM 12163]